MGYEQKDRDAVALYLNAGVHDMLLVDPRQQTVAWHCRTQVAQLLTLLTTCTLQMGCLLPIDRA